MAGPGDAVAWAFEGLLLLEVEDRPTGRRRCRSTCPPYRRPPANRAREAGHARPAENPAQFGAAADAKELATQSSAAATASVATAPPRTQDMAERYFPRGGQRMGTRASGIALATMLLLLVGAIHATLMSRDVH